MRFPLADWIDGHAGVAHNLGQSGLKGAHASLEATLLRPEEPDADALTEELARLVGVPIDRLFLTHGASEGNALVLVFLARYLAGPRSQPVRFTTPTPDYPPLPDGAEWAGLRRAGRSARADVVACSDPNNPTGLALSDNAAFGACLEDARAVLVDETFREFTDSHSRAATSDSRVWATGTFTKVYGADRIRVGFVVAPGPAAPVFARFHGIMTDEIAPTSVAAARAILRDRTRLLSESRQRLARNLAALRGSFPDAPALKAPFHFDRGPDGLDGDGFAEFALREGVLVCPGSYFGDPTGVRLCLTRTTFPDDLRAYLAAREAWLRRSPVRTTGPRRRPASRPPRGAP